MRLDQLLCEAFSNEDALNTIHMALRSLHVEVVKGIKNANEALSWNDSSNAIQIMRPIGNWLNDNYLNNKRTNIGGYGIETAITLLSKHPKFAQPAKEAIKNTKFYATTEKPESSWDIVQRLVGYLAQILDKSNNRQMSQFVGKLVEDMEQLDVLRKRLRAIRSKDVGIDVPTSNNQSNRKQTVGIQNKAVEDIINQQLSQLPKNVADDYRRQLARSDNKLQALQRLLQQ